MATIREGPPSIEDLQVLGQKIIHQTRMDLLMGSSNVESDRLKSADWTPELLETIRFGHVWVKDTGKKSQWSRKSEGESEKKSNDTDFYSMNAERAARAYYNRAGNCNEMSLVALYNLSKFIASNAEYRNALINGDIAISVVAFPQPYDHMVIKVDKQEQDASGKKISNSIIIDPWFGEDGCFSSKNFDSYKMKVVQKLIKEVEAIIRLSYPNAMEAQELIDQVERDHQDHLALLTLQNFIPCVPIRSPLILDHYIQSFDKDYLYLKQSYNPLIKEKLLTALNKKDKVPIVSYLEQGAALDKEVLEAAFATSNKDILEKLTRPLFQKSKYYVGDLGNVDIDTLDKNSIFLAMEDNKLVCVHKNNNNIVQKLPISLFFEASSPASVETRPKKSKIMGGISIGSERILLSDPETVDEELEKFAKSKNANSLTPFMVQQLIDENIILMQNKGYLSPRKQTLLMLYAENGNSRIVQKLIDMGISADVKDDEDNSALIYTAVKNDAKTTEILLQVMSKDYINAANKNRDNPLTLAAARGHTEIVKLLLQRGADVNYQDKNGNTALMWAVGSNHPEVVRILMMYGAETTRKNNFGQTAMNLLRISEKDNPILMRNMLTQFQLARKPIVPDLSERTTPSKPTPKKPSL